MALLICCPNKTYIIGAGLPEDTAMLVKIMVVQKSEDGTNWSTAFGTGLSGVNGANNSSGTSIEDVLVTTQPTKLRIISASNGLNLGVWLRLQVM